MTRFPCKLVATMYVLQSTVVVYESECAYKMLGCILWTQ